VSALKKAVEWRISVIAATSSQKSKKRQTELQVAYQSIESPLLKNIMASFAKEQKKRPAPSIEDLTKAKRWCSLSEFQEAVQKVEPEFRQLVERIKQDPGYRLTTSEKRLAVQCTIAFLYGYQRAHRPGPIQCMTVQDFQEVKQHKRFTTQKFKTVSTYGALTITFNHRTVELWTLYEQYIRPRLLNQGEKVPEFLLTVNGKPHTKLHEPLQAFTKNFLDVTLTPTTIRAMLATEVNSKTNQQNASIFHRADTHSNQIVARTYDKACSTRYAEQADETYNTLFPLSFTSSSSSSEADEVKKANDNATDEVKKANDNATEEEEEEEEPELGEPQEPVAPKRRRVPWQKEEIQWLVDICNAKGPSQKKKICSATFWEQQLDQHQGPPQVYENARQPKSLADNVRRLFRGEFLDKFGIDCPFGFE